MTDVAAIKICGANPDDAAAVLKLLERNGFGSDGVEANIGTFVTACDEQGQLIGCGGSEAFPFAALIRTVVVDAEHRRAGLGRRIVRELLDRLASRGLREFYVVAPPATESFFRKRGFRQIDRDELHPQLLSSSEVAAASDDAICMRLVMH